MRHTALAAALFGSAAISTGVWTGADELPPVFTPDDPHYVVLELPAESRTSAVDRARASRDARYAAESARSHLARARSDREPALFDEAELILRPWMARAESVGAELLVLQADIEQYRHAFDRALGLLDLALAREPGDAQGRLMRATIHMVRGDFQAARRDCQAVLAAGAGAVGSVCVAQTVGAGDPARGMRLVRTWLEHPQAFTREQRAWALETLADLEMRSGNRGAAEAALRQAVQSWPGGETARIALASLLVSQDRASDALPFLDIERPSPAALVQRARAHRELGQQAQAHRTAELVRRLLRVEESDGRRVHLREEAQLALHLDDEPERALRLAQENFLVQRESVDARLLADAARAAGSETAMKDLRAWMDEADVRDAHIERLLVGSNR